MSYYFRFASMLLLFPCFLLAQERMSPAAPGKLFDAGGHLIHIHIQGTGGPAVIFENGSGDFSFIWDLVQPAISKTTTTVSYDRAGYAWSEVGSVPRTGAQIAYELHTALEHAGIKGPYILVGQSYGGFLVRTFARIYRKEMAGMVLVDALNENEQIMINNQPTRIRDFAKGRLVPPIDSITEQAADTVKENNPLEANTMIEPPLDRLSPEDQQLQLWAQAKYAYYKAVSNEMDWSPEDVANMYKHKGEPDYMLGNIPLIVLSKSKGYYGNSPDSAELEKTRIKLQIELSHLSTNGKQITDLKSGHNIHLEDPELVVQCIEQVITAYKNHSRL
jgi:pimeloyl-ACP methyl ester carboxylesterase